MSVWLPTPNPIPDGVVLAHTVHGEPQNQYMHAHMVPVGTERLGVQSVDFSHIPWDGTLPEEPPVVPPPEPVVPVEPRDTPRDNRDDPILEPASARAAGREKKCHAKDDTCNGWAINGSDFCSGHAGKLAGWGHK